MTVQYESATLAETTGISRVSSKIRIVVVSSLDERQMAMAVRAAVYLGKPGWTYAHTFDANDHCATQILALVDGEPAGTVRVRWFAQAARIERIAILPQFRSLAVLNQLAHAALRLCRKKGYEKACGLTYPELLKFWGRHGGAACGEPIASEYGTVVPIVATPRHWPDIQSLDFDEMGSAEFEWRAYAWEGAGV